jgi:hypothetical protein
LVKGVRKIVGAAQQQEDSCRLRLEGLLLLRNTDDFAARIEREIGIRSAKSSVPPRHAAAELP